MKNFFQVTLTTFIVIGVMMSWFLSGAEAAADPGPFQQAQVTLTFDDARVSPYVYALPVLAERNIPAVAYVTTGFIGQQDFMNWSQIKDLQNIYQWEIGGHTVNHPELPTLTQSAIRTEVTNSLNALKSNGLNVTSFAFPYGAYDNKTLKETMKLYNDNRGFWDRDDLNTFPYNRSVMMVQSVEKGVSVATIKGWIDQAIAQKKWLILVYHEIKPDLDADYEYEQTVNEFTQVADYIKASGIKVVTPNSLLPKPGTNLLTNSSFTLGVSPGWTTSNASRVKLNTGNNGSFPSPLQSISFTGGSGTVRLTSDFVTINANDTYSLESFVNTDNLTRGQIAFAIDEYDNNNNLLSSPTLGTVGADKVTLFNSLYKSSSNNVTKVKVKVSYTASFGTAFVDNINLYNLTNNVATITPTPTPTPTPTLTPTPTPTPTPVQGNNLVPNPSFEQTSNSWALSWLKDNNNYSIDNLSNGNDGPNSVRLIPNATQSHLFSSLITVDPAKTYQWNQFIKALYNWGEFGFYIDEYNSTGTWISGQWKGAITANFTGIRSINYQPTSSQVNKVRLQYYADSGSNINLYLDSIYFGQ